MAYKAKKNKTTANKTMDTYPFDKANAQDFGKRLYQDDSGVVSFLKLCDGTLQDSVYEGKPLHCVLGEAYLTFINSSSRELLDIGTDDAIEFLAKKAIRKNNRRAGLQALRDALVVCANVNDGIIGDEDDNVSYLTRAQAVAEAWNDKVVPLLK